VRIHASGFAELPHAVALREHYLAVIQHGHTYAGYVEGLHGSKDVIIQIGQRGGLAKCGESE
jgi:hypothetical protein